MQGPFMKLPPLKPGYVYENIAPLGEKPDWVAKVAPLPDDGKLFGYDPEIFMKKQYRT